MSRAGYSDDFDNWDMIKWRGRVASSIRGKRGQAFLADLLAALDAMPVKELAPNRLHNADGQFCTLGAICHVKGIDMAPIDDLFQECQEDVAADKLSELLNIASPLVREIMWHNDEFMVWDPHQGRLKDEAALSKRRWEEMRKWVVDNLRQPKETEDRT